MTSHADAVFIMLDLLAGSYEQTTDWAARHGLVDPSLDDIDRAITLDHATALVEQDHERALVMDRDRDILVLGQVRPRPSPPMPALCPLHGQPMVPGRYGDDGVPDMLCVCTLAAAEPIPSCACKPHRIFGHQDGCLYEGCGS